eukprot:s2186_g1.t1
MKSKEWRRLLVVEKYQTVAGRIHLIEDACHTLEKKAVKNIGKGALWRRGDLAVRAGGQGLCEITATNMKSEMDVQMCVTGANLTLDRGMLVPMTRKEMEELRKLLSEMEAAKAEQTRLQEAVTQSCDQLRQKHEKLVEQIELELEDADHGAFSFLGHFGWCTLLQTDPWRIGYPLRLLAAPMTSVPPPCAPPPPAAAVQRHRRKRYDGSLHQVVDLHELHSHLPELTAPWREAFQPVTVLCAGRIQLDQRCVVMNPRSPGLRGIFASWLKDMAGDGDRYQDLQIAFSDSTTSAGDLSLWLVVDWMMGFVGWAVFGSAWGGVKTGCRRLMQISIVLLVCLVFHYVWSVCYPVVSIVMACLMAVVWILRKILKAIGTVFFYAQRFSGGAPEAADAEFHGPGTGAVPETALLRSFKRSGDNPKQVVVRRGDEVAVFSVGSDQQSIRTHGLYLPIEPDSVRGTPALVRRLSTVDRVHLCRNLACTEEAAEHFAEYGLVKQLNAERFQVKQSHQGALGISKYLWTWLAPAGRKTVTEVVGRIREFASKSETEDVTCCASQVTWMTDEGLKSLAEVRCSVAGQPFHQAIEGDIPEGSTGSFCTKHATLYLSKRLCDKCGVVGCYKLGDRFHSGVRWCCEHEPVREGPEASTSRRRRSRTRTRARVEDEVLPEADEEFEDEDPENGEGRARSLMRSASEAADPQRRTRRRPPTRSPGHTPKSNIQRNLARIEMLSSPGSEVEPRLLEMFVELFADGKQEGIREDQVRTRIARERVISEVDVLRRLIEEAEVEKNKGQRGLSRFLTKWRKDLSLREKPSPESDWSMMTVPVSSEKSSPPPTECPPIPLSFSQPATSERSEEAPPPVQPSLRVYGRPETPAVDHVPSATRRAESLRIAPPSLYQLGDVVDRRAGAVEGGGEPVEQIAKALQSQTAELASLVRHQVDGSGTQPAGTLKGLGRQSEELVFLMRACGQYDVKIGEGEHGQALANGLIAAQVGAATKLRSSGFRQRMTQRLAIGLAGPYWGIHEKHALSASDFIGYTDAELDQFASEVRGPKGMTAEQRPALPTRFDEWVARVRRQTDVWCLVYGAEWRQVRTSALELLSEWHLSLPHRWPLNVVMDLWEELHWRCMEDFKEILRRLKKEIGRETLTLPELKFHALLPGPDGQAWLVMPTVFDLQRPGSWFQEEVLPRIDRKQERLLWNLTWQGSQRRDRAPQPGPTTAAGSSEVDRPTMKALWGPKLTPEEVSRAKERAPLDRSGNLLCWGHLCHVGCSVPNCQRSHEALRGSFESLDPAVQLQLLKRGGLKRMKMETKESVQLKVKEIRTRVEKEKSEKVQDGKRRASGADKKEKPGAVAEEQNPSEGHGDGKAGSVQKHVRFWEPPEEFKVDFTAQEDVKQLVDGPQRSWDAVGFRPERQHEGQDGTSAPAAAHHLVKEAQRLGKSEVLAKLEEASDDLYAWAAARVARDPQVSFHSLMTEMATYGLGELANEAANFLECEGDGKAGSARLQVQPAQWSGEGPGHGVAEIDGKHWRFYDYKEEVPMTDELASLLKVAEPSRERRQCVTLSLAAGIFRRQHGRWPSMTEVQLQAQQLRLEQARLAVEAATTIGVAEEMVSPVEHEARIYIHDLVTANHEKDFRSLAMFPVQELQDARVVVLRADYRGGLIVESVIGGHWSPGGWVLPVLIWKGHMVALEAPDGFDLEAFIQQEEYSSTPALGFTFFWHSRHDQARTAPGRLHCRLCKGDRRAGEFLAACRQHSCLAAVATMAAGGPQSSVVRDLPAPRGHGGTLSLVLQEVFAGTGRITQSWRKNGVALEPIEVYDRPHTQDGYRGQHDLLRPEVRQGVLKTCEDGDANVWWIAAPCTSYCDWQLQNGGTRTFDAPLGTGLGPLAQREADGNVLSQFAADLFEKALDRGQFPVCESSASSGRYPKQWDLPAWRRILQRDDVDYLDFVMCAWGLGPPDRSDEFYVHKTRLVFPRHEPLRRLLLRPCPGVGPHHKHVALKGARDGQSVTRCTEAGAYAWDFVHAVVTVLQSTLGGARFLPPQLPQSGHAGGKRGRGSDVEDEEDEMLEEVCVEEETEMPAEEVNPNVLVPEERNAPEERNVAETLHASGLNDAVVNVPASASNDVPVNAPVLEGNEVPADAESVEDEEAFENALAPEDEEQNPGKGKGKVTRVPSLWQTPEELDRLHAEAEMRELFGEEIEKFLTAGSSTGPWCSTGSEEQQRMIDEIVGEPAEEDMNEAETESLAYEPSIADDAPAGVWAGPDSEESEESEGGEPDEPVGGGGLPPAADFWEAPDFSTGTIRRVHVVYRQHLFVPNLVEVPGSCQLQAERKTFLVNQRNVRVRIEDNWQEAGEVNVGYGQWTGFTVFPLQNFQVDWDRWRSYGFSPSNSGSDDGERPEDESEEPEETAETEEPEGASGGGRAGQSNGTGGKGTGQYTAPNLAARQAALDYVKEVQECFENTAKAWIDLMQRGNALVKAAGGVQAAAESLWEAREGQGLMNLSGVDSQEFDEVLHPDHLEYLRDVRKYGMSARYLGSRHRVEAKLHPNARRNVDQVYKQIAKDAKKHRVLVVDGKIPELADVVSSPFEAVDKMLPDRTISAEKRVVHDQRTVNQATSKYWHPPALQPLHSQVARRILWAKHRAPGIPVLMAKKDISGAFRLLWVDPADVSLFAGDLPWQPDKAFKETKEEVVPPRGDVTVIYLVSSFGFSGSPGEWCMWGRATEEYHRGHQPLRSRRDMSDGFDAKVLVDDCILVEPRVGLRPWVSTEVFEDGVMKLLGNQAVNKEKDEVEGFFKTTQTVWGIIMETQSEHAMLPERRIQKGAVLLAGAAFDHGRKDITLKEMQQFRGILTGWAAIVPGLGNELKAADKFLRGTDGRARVMVNLKGDGTAEWETRMAWEDLWEVFEVCRWLSSRTSQWELLFSTTLREMLPPLERLSLPGEWGGTVFVSSDATTLVVGAIDWKHGCVFREKVADLKPWILQVLTDEEIEAEGEDIVVHLAEMLSFVAFACAMAERWRNQIVVYAGDNMVVRHWLQRRKSAVRGGRILVRVVNMLEMRWRFRLLAGWWRTYHNIDADHLTRCSDEEYLDFADKKGWQKVDVKTAVQSALEDSQRFGPCFLYATDDEDRRVLLQLKERRMKRQVQQDPQIPWPSIRVVEWKVKGRTVLDYEMMAGLLGARLEAGTVGGPVILCATLGVDEQGRHLHQVLEAAKTSGAWLVIIEGPRAVAWDIGEKRCTAQGWGCKLVEFVTTELGEAMARRRRCLLVRPGGALPDSCEEGLVRVGAPVPVHTILKQKPWEDLVWRRPARLQLESGIPRDRMLPCPIGHFAWSEDGERETCHSTDGPCLWPKLVEGKGGVEPVYVFDRRGPPGHLRQLTDEEIWKLQGRSVGDLKHEQNISARVREGCRATGAHTASSLLLWAGHLVEGFIEEEAGRAGMCPELDGPESLAQILLWLRRWKRGEFGRRAGGYFEEEKVYHVNRWAESWWLSMLDGFEDSSSDEEPETYAGGRKPKRTAEEVAEEVSKQFVTSVGLTVRPFCGEVGERVEEWLEENMHGDKSPATEKAYASAWAKWKAWAKRQEWVSEYLDRSEDAVERENKLLAYVGYLGWLGASVNTIRQSIFAIKLAHKRVGAGDITEGMHRVWILLGGLDRRSTTRKPRCLGVTQEMLQWLGHELIGAQEPASGSTTAADASMAFAAVSTAWFFMLRCKEFAESNGVDKDMILRGCDIRFSTGGVAVEEEPEEVTLQMRKTKVDQMGYGEAKTLKATGRRFLCPVEALCRMRRFWPNRFQAMHQEGQKPLFRWASGGVLRRLEIQHFLQTAAGGVGLPRDRFLSHSLRIGGATALFQATSDIELVKRLGRWNSSAVHRSLVTVSAFTAAMNERSDLRPLGEAGPCEVQAAIQALERFVADVATKDRGDIPSFVAVRVGLRSQLGDASFQTTALWLDLSVDELMTETAMASELQKVKAFLETREVSGPQPLLQTLLPALQGQEALKVVICGPPDDPATGAAHDQLSSLLRLLAPEDAASCLELSSLREVQPDLGNLLTFAFQDLRCSRIAFSEFLTGEVCLKDFGFPGHILPKLPMKYQVTNHDRVKLHLAAESAMEDFEARGWGSSSSRSAVLHLADCYELPPEVLTTSSVHTFARSQDQYDPLVRTIARLREDVSCAVALLPLCATHPFNLLRVLQLGGIHSLLALLADSSSLALERRGEAVEELSDAEISAMVLMVLCASRAIRRFLVSQGIFELLAVAIRYPSSSRQLQIFCGFLVRLLRDPEHRHQPLGQPLAEQLGDLLQRPDATLSAQAVAAASAALSPLVPVEAFEPLLPRLLGSAARTPEAFKALCASLTLSAARRHGLGVGPGDDDIIEHSY